jgi:hypothetical protein
MTPRRWDYATRPGCDVQRDAGYQGEIREIDNCPRRDEEIDDLTKPDAIDQIP